MYIAIILRLLISLHKDSLTKLQNSSQKLPITIEILSYLLLA